MKKLYFIIFLISTLITNAQIVNIPDANFKSALISEGVDTNNDGEIQVSEAQATITLSFGNESISDLTGLEEFTSLETLDFATNLFSTIDLSANTSLISVELDYNGIDTITLGTLPNLEYLNIGYADLQTINVSNCPALKTLLLPSNDLASIDVSNNSNLENLNLAGNDLTSIDVSNNLNLKELNLAINMFSALDLSNNIALERITLFNNQLINLDVSNNINLERLSIFDNQITSLDVSVNTALEILYAQNNQLSTLDLSNNTELLFVDVSNNQLTTLELFDENNYNLSQLDCSFNQLTSFDASKLQYLDVYDSYSFSIRYNPNLTYINLKNGLNANYFYVDNQIYDGLPNLESICVDNVDSYFVELLQDEVGSEVLFTQYCSFTPGGEFYTIEGTTRLDLDANGCDINDSGYSNFAIHTTNGSEEATFFSNASGEYTIPLQAGNYTITPQMEVPMYFSTTPLSFNANFPTDTSPLIQDFCVAPNGTHNDLEILVVPLELARPGFETDYKLIYRNKGNTTLSGSINFTYNDDFMDLQSSTPMADVQNVGDLTWNYSNMLPLETREIPFTMLLNTPTDMTFPLNGDDVLSFTATVSPSNADETPEDNMFQLNQIVVNSFDPNDITCLEGNEITPEQVGEYVHYLIRFENTGTASAVNVVVKDVIDTSKYDIASLVPLNASHAFYARVQNDNEVEFIFENIQLPFDDANNDGYVLFKIRTLSTLNLGDSFSNQAGIYFDFNSPIITNNETTTIEENLSIEEFELSELKVYPNPTYDDFKIENLNNQEVKAIELYTISGKKLREFPVSDHFKINDLSAGVYFIKIKTEQKERNIKIIKL